MAECIGATDLADELHVTVLNTVVDHLDVVASTLVTDPLAAGLAIALGSNGLEDVLDVGPGSLVTTGHERRAVAGTLLTTRDTGTNEVEALGGKVLCPAVAVGEVRVTAINDDVALLEEGEEGLDPVIDGLAGLDEEHDAAGGLELGDELLGGLGTNNRLALGLVGKEVVDLGNGTVEGADGEAMVGHVEDQVLTPITYHVSEAPCGTVEGDARRALTYMTARPMRPISALGASLALV